MTSPTTATSPGRPEQFGHEFFRPNSYLWWLYLLACVFCCAGQTIELASSTTSTLSTLPIFGLIFAGTTAIFIAAMMPADPYRTRRPWIMLLAFGGGYAISSYLSLLVNSPLPSLLLHIFGEEITLKYSATLSGPTSEEWFKTLVIVMVMMLAKPTMTRLTHGAMVGAFVGLGFQIAENISYSLDSSAKTPREDIVEPLFVNFFRFLGGFSGHNLISTFAGVGVAVLLGCTVSAQWSRQQRILVAFGLYCSAWGIHFVWNIPSPGSLAFPLIFGKAAVGIAVLLLLLRWVWAEERLFLREAATAVSGDQLTGLQAAAIGDRATRKAFFKKTKQAGGRRQVRTARQEMHDYLDRLQAWGRRGTGIDEHPSDASTPAPDCTDEDTLYLEPVPQLRPSRTASSPRKRV
ncbi:PrsW family intramembrane metalloprotease [Austwickia chelonae]|uniref:PrsW family intramembrane metalloprotease n=1 Tax=Austwickia chelonae TaxID=100225 RepID=UPI000E26F7F6|nr:PrsW family intramembrane metalloprotease [Austwickia chelonae]